MKVMCFWVVLVALTLAVKAERRPNAISIISTNLSTNDEEDFEDITENPRILARKRCVDVVGRFVNNTFHGLEVEYDVAEIFETFGGPPGKVNTTLNKKDEAPVKTEDMDKRPLPDADEQYWIYKYVDTDNETYSRTEHAAHRFNGTLKEFLDIRGVIYFTPDDFCGSARKLIYSVDDRGLRFEVTREYCTITEPPITCAWPPDCTSDIEGDLVECVLYKSG